MCSNRIVFRWNYGNTMWSKLWLLWLTKLMTWQLRKLQESDMQSKPVTLWNYKSWEGAQNLLSYNKVAMRHLMVVKFLTSSTVFPWILYIWIESHYLFLMIDLQNNLRDTYLRIILLVLVSEQNLGY